MLNEKISPTYTLVFELFLQNQHYETYISNHVKSSSNNYKKNTKNAYNIHNCGRFNFDKELSHLRA